MLNVALTFIPAGDNDGQVVFFAQPVAGPAYLVIAALVGMVVLMVNETNRIEDQMIMNMPLVNMGGKYKLVKEAIFKYRAERSAHCCSGTSHGKVLQLRSS